MSRAGYKRGWHHTKGRGSEGTVTCGFCGRLVPKYKTFSVVKGFSINDPLIKSAMGPEARRGLILSTTRIQACPACARHRNIVQKKHTQYKPKQDK